MSLNLFSKFYYNLLFNKAKVILSYSLFQLFTHLLLLRKFRLVNFAVLQDIISTYLGLKGSDSRARDAVSTELLMRKYHLCTRKHLFAHKTQCLLLFVHQAVFSNYLLYLPYTKISKVIYVSHSTCIKLIKPLFIQLQLPKYSYMDSQIFPTSIHRQSY